MVWRACSPMSLAIALDKLQAQCQGIGILAGGGQRFGELKLQVQVFGIGGQGRSGRPRARPADLLGLEPQRQLGLELLGLGLEKAASLQARESAPGLRRAAPARSAIRASPTWAAGRSGSSARAALYFASAAFGSVASSSSALRRRSSRPAWARAGRSRSGSPTRAAHPRSRRRALPSRTPKTAGIDRTPNCTGQLGLAFGIDLGQHKLAVILPRQLLQHRTQHAARAAPGRPEVDHDRNRTRPLDHVLLKVLRRRLDHERRIVVIRSSLIVSFLVFARGRGPFNRQSHRHDRTDGTHRQVLYFGLVHDITEDRSSRKNAPSLAGIQPGVVIRTLSRLVSTGRTAGASVESDSAVLRRCAVERRAADWRGRTDRVSL